MTGPTGQEKGRTSKPAAQQPLRIIVLDDELGFRESLKLFLAFEFPNAEILTFNDSLAAVKELTRSDPDLFTTDIHHPGVNSRDILEMLARRKVTYPIFVISACEPEPAKSFLSQFSENLNIAFLSKPPPITELRALLSQFFSKG